VGRYARYNGEERVPSRVSQSGLDVYSKVGGGSILPSPYIDPSAV
jgi:hypothetical protein